jgi:hypothetical protein
MSSKDAELVDDALTLLEYASFMIPDVGALVAGVISIIHSAVRGAPRPSDGQAVADMIREATAEHFSEELAVFLREEHDDYFDALHHLEDRGTRGDNAEDLFRSRVRAMVAPGSSFMRAVASLTAQDMQRRDFLAWQWAMSFELLVLQQALLLDAETSEPKASAYLPMVMTRLHKSALHATRVLGALDSEIRERKARFSELREVTTSFPFPVTHYDFDDGQERIEFGSAMDREEAERRRREAMDAAELRVWQSYFGEGDIDAQRRSRSGVEQWIADLCELRDERIRAFVVRDDEGDPAPPLLTSVPLPSPLDDGLVRTQNVAIDSFAQDGTTHSAIRWIGPSDEHWVEFALPADRLTRDHIAIELVHDNADPFRVATIGLRSAGSALHDLPVVFPQTGGWDASALGSRFVPVELPDDRQDLALRLQGSPWGPDLYGFRIHPLVGYAGSSDLLGGDD